MKYRNVKTGYEFETDCACKGEDLELVEDKKAVKPVTRKRKAVAECQKHSQQ